MRKKIILVHRVSRLNGFHAFTTNMLVFQVFWPKWQHLTLTNAIRGIRLLYEKDTFRLLCHTLIEGDQAKSVISWKFLFTVLAINMIKIELQRHTIPHIKPFGKRIKLLSIIFLYLNFFITYSQNRIIVLSKYHGFCLITL